MRFLLLVALGAGVLVACAPTMGPTASAGSTFRAAFSDQGVAFVTAGRACVARAPSYQTVCPRLPAAVDVAWNGGDAWAAVPSLGVVVTLDRAARSVNVGRVVALSATRAYREDGSAVSYGGTPVGGVTGAPTLALTGGNGADYVLLAGSLVTVPGGAKLEGASGTFLVSTLTGARASMVPATESVGGTYQLSGGRLERLDLTGHVVASVPHPEGRIGVVGTEVVTVTADGMVRVYSETLADRLH
ncbi:hypothetical protein E7T09_14755 [Deinococcus sp. KSM4-11]|uniref:hypothetical protein n=1 Tax=Deinococcus sp. KSM4-11 TaxID=2568654 RepID=UPI0010A5790D|nr:hypothetical protein [Deinococcus sp. KSM4-11]THF85791.1 hypothetical protein E7T09_14755 [Deinococcus sp. KSM4-11]